MSDDKRHPRDEDELTLVWDDWDDDPETDVGEQAAARDEPAAPGPTRTQVGPTDELDPDLDILLDDDDEDADAETRIAEIPDELMATLQELDDRSPTAENISAVSTKPPPAGHDPEASGALELPDSSGLFPAERPAPTPAPKPTLQTATPGPDEAEDDTPEWEIEDDEDDEATVLFESDALELAGAMRPPPASPPPPPHPLPASPPPAPSVPPPGEPPLRLTDPEIESAIADVLDAEWSDPALQDDLADLAPPSDAPPAPTTSSASQTPSVASKGAPSARPARAAAVDRMAQAARRTVRSRKPRVEHMPLVGSGAEVEVARRELLYDLAQASRGTRRAALFVQAGSLAESQGDLLAAREAYDEAREADTASAEPLRALQRVAALEGDWAGAYGLLLAEAELATLDAPTRAEAATAAAMVALSHLDDPERCIEAGRKALALEPGHTHAAALVARAHAGERDGQAQAALLALADRTEDGALAAALRVDAAIACEQGGDLERALGLYQRALEEAPEDLDAWLGTARTAHAMGQHDLAQRALGSLAARTPDDTCKLALQRPRARLLAERLARPLEALPALQQATDPVALRERVKWAQLADDPEPALRARAEHTSGTERALAYIELAEWYDAGGEHGEAERCLALAREADGTLSLTRVVREVLARRAGDTSGLAEATAEDAEDASAALAAAARLASDVSAVDTERTWLERASSRGGTSAYMRVLQVDAAAQAGDASLVTRELAQLGEHADPEVTLAACLTMADRARRDGDQEAFRAALKQALEAAPSEPLTLRAMGRASDTNDERARWLEREASLGDGAMAAGLHLARARLLSGDARRAALAEARAADRSYLPARLAAIASARARGELDALQALCSETAREAEGAGAVAWLVRAALIGAETDSDAATELLVQAARLAPDDAILRVLVSRVGDALPAALRAEMYAHGVEASENGPLSRARRLNAAGAHEDAGQVQEARALYEQVLQYAPEDAAAVAAMERLQQKAGEYDASLERAERLAKEANSAFARMRALRACARLALAKGDLAAAERFARQGVTCEPADPECARILERCVSLRGDHAQQLDLQRQLLETSTGPLDRGARVRVLSALLREGETGHDHGLEEALCRLADRCAGGPWLARRLISAGQQRAVSHAITAGWTLMLSHAVTPAERATTLLRLSERHPPQDAGVTDMLRGALQASPDNGVVAEQLAMRLERAQHYSEAAEILEQAAKVAESSERQVRLWHRASVLWQDRAESPERARASLRAAADIDVAYADVSSRLERLLGGEDDVGGLIGLTETRLSAGGAPHEIAQLHRNLADLHVKNGDRSAARENLRAALALEPDHVGSLRTLAELHERDREYRECAETWIQVARKLKDPQELADVFFKLGRLYDEQLPDETRAAAAYRRVLKLLPRHGPSLRALADLYDRQGNTDAVIDTLARLASAESEPGARTNAVLRLAQRLEKAGRGSEAERVLEGLRKSRPYDLAVLSALADLYRKQAAGSALAMHTNRAAGDLRHAIAEHIDDANLWRTLVHVLGWRGRAELPRIVGTTAVALGIDDPQLRAQAVEPGGLSGAGGGALERSVQDLLAPEGLSRSLRHVLAETAEALEKIMPFDPRAAAAEKLARKHPLRGPSREIARWFGQREADIWVSPRVPTAFLTVSDTGPTFVVGSTIVDGLTAEEQRFLLARAYAFTACRMSVVCRVSPEDLTVLLHGLIRAFVEDHKPLGLDEATMESTAQRIHKVLPRKLRDELHDEVVEIGGAHDFDPTALYALCSRMTSRLALVATGAVHGSLSALCKLAGSLAPEVEPALAIRRTREARQLASFAISETHFEARRRAGADGG